MSFAKIAGTVALTGFMCVSVFAGSNCKTKADCGSKEKYKKETSMKSSDAADAKHQRHMAYKAEYPSLSTEELMSAIDAGKVTVIDVNGTDSYQKSHVKSAVNFYDAKQLSKALPKSKDALIVAYCGGPKCSAWTKAIDYLKGAGYTNLRHYEDGLKGWQAAMSSTKEKSKKS